MNLNFDYVRYTDESLNTLNFRIISLTNFNAQFSIHVNARNMSRITI